MKINYDTQTFRRTAQRTRDHPTPMGGRSCPDDGPVVLFDKVMGNAAALLAVKARAGEVYSPLGSELAIETLRKNDIAYHLDRVIPFIQKDNSEEMCFMENLSRGKTPDEFYTTIKAIIK